mmetsp:Transcript_321/g.1195  ORF Transcript_321/g.1195 Transcript_321/m.1195 type:complete len:209 (+) Transcript_321:273-899(+)
MASIAGSHVRVRVACSGHSAISSVTFMTNTRATHVAFFPPFSTPSFFNAFLRDLNENSPTYVHVSPLTPASSIDSRAAASSAVSSVSQPPFGKINPSLCLLLTMHTSTPPLTRGLSLTGMHPATSLWESCVYRCFSRPCLDMRGVGKAAGSVDIGGASIGEDGESDAEVDPLPEWSTPDMLHAPVDASRTRSAAHRGRRVPSKAGLSE